MNIIRTAWEFGNGGPMTVMMLGDNLIYSLTHDFELANYQLALIHQEIGREAACAVLAGVRRRLDQIITH